MATGPGVERDAERVALPIPARAVKLRGIMSFDSGPVAALGWLVFAVGVGVILIAVIPRKSQVRSPTRKVAGAASGVVFCLVAALLMLQGLSSSTQWGLAIAAVVATAASWYLGRHARKMDRLARRHR